MHIKTANGKKKVVMSRREWELIGRRFAGSNRAVDDLIKLHSRLSEATGAEMYKVLKRLSSNWLGTAGLKGVSEYSGALLETPKIKERLKWQVVNAFLQIRGSADDKAGFLANKYLGGVIYRLENTEEPQLDWRTINSISQAILPLLQSDAFKEIELGSVIETLLNFKKGNAWIARAGEKMSKILDLLGESAHIVSQLVVEHESDQEQRREYKNKKKQEEDEKKIQKDKEIALRNQEWEKSDREKTALRRASEELKEYHRYMNGELGGGHLKDEPTDELYAELDEILEEALTPLSEVDRFKGMDYRQIAETLMGNPGLDYGVGQVIININKIFEAKEAGATRVWATDHPILSLMSQKLSGLFKSMGKPNPVDGAKRLKRAMFFLSELSAEQPFTGMSPTEILRFIANWDEGMMPENPRSALNTKEKVLKLMEFAGLSPLSSPSEIEAFIADPTASVKTEVPVSNSAQHLYFSPFIDSIMRTK